MFSHIIRFLYIVCCMMDLYLFIFSNNKKKLCCVINNVTFYQNIKCITLSFPQIDITTGHIKTQVIFVSAYKVILE